MIICIDGANFVGKTTIINDVKKSIPNLVVIEDYEINNEASIKGNFLDARLEIQKKYDFETAQNDILVCRWFPSMYVFDYSGNYNKFKNDMKKLIAPDDTFVIGTSFINIIKRRKSRYGFKLSKSIIKQLFMYKRISKRLNYKYFINNTISQKERIVETIVDAFLSSK